MDKYQIVAIKKKYIKKWYDLLKDKTPYEILSVYTVVRKLKKERNIY